MKLPQSKLHSVVHGLMADIGLMDRPATVDEIVKICQAVVADNHEHKPEPLAPKLVVPEEPDEESAKQALFTACGLSCWKRL